MVNGAIRNGVTYMPKFEGVVKQEGLWAIRSWLETVSVDAPAQPATASSTTTTSSSATPAASSSSSSTTSTAPAASTEPSKETKPTASM